MPPGPRAAARWFHLPAPRRPPARAPPHPAGRGYSSRALLLFGGLEAFVPSKRTTLDAVTLNVTINNTGGAAVVVEGMLLKQAWKGTDESGAERSLGWVYRRPHPTKPTSG